MIYQNNRVRLSVLALALLLAGFGVSTTLAQTRAYVGNRNGFSLSVLDTATNTLVASIPLEAEPNSLAVTPDGRFVYLAHASGAVSVINARNNAVVASIQNGLSAIRVAISPNGAFAYVTNS